MSKDSSSFRVAPLLAPLTVVAMATVAYATGVTTVYTYDANGNLKNTVDVSSDAANCGGIGAVCTTGQTCCAGECANLSTSTSHCGSCGVACSSSHVTPTCGGTPPTCGGTCAAGWGDCDGNKQANGCETPLDTTTNCGACGASCSTNHITPVCSGGSCASGVCAAGYSDCNGNKLSDGCEVYTAGDVSNCGGCGIVCSTNHVTPACSGGSCASGICAAGYSDCNGNKQSDGCEAYTAGDVSNCGGCGIVCSTNHVTPACSGGSCASGICAAGYSDCNGNKQSDGCEVYTAGDANNCGVCGRVCATGYACNGGTCVCQPGTCASLGYSCGSVPDGCGGTLNCGPCSTGYTCSGGVCIKACPAGYQDCDGRCLKICP